MSVPTTERLAAWAQGFDLSNVPPGTVELMKHSLLDSIGCAYVSRPEECVAGVLAMVRAQGGAGHARVIGEELRLPLGPATLANATLVRALDINDHMAFDPNTGAKLGGHPSDMLAALLAAAEHHDRSGADVLAAAVVAYEIYGRVNALLGPQLPWDHATAFGVAVPAALGRLLRLSERETAHAIGLACAHAATLGVVRRGQLSHAKFLAGPWACARAVDATLLAAAGVTGPLTVFEDSRGFDVGVARLAGASDVVPPNPLNKALIEGVTIKGFPGMDTTQAAEEAAIAVAGELSSSGRLAAADIAAVELVMADHPMTRNQAGSPERQRPDTRETADHSYQYLVAVALLDGEVTPRQFAHGRWHEPDLVALLSRIEVSFDKGWNTRAPGGFPCTVRVRLRDGREAHAEVAYARGHARNKMSAADVEAKFIRNISDLVSEDRARRIVEAVARLETLPIARDLMNLLG